MSSVSRILFSAFVLAGFTTIALTLGGCGQKGSLYLPTDPAAAQRATLPQIINATMPFVSGDPAPLPPASAASKASAPLPPASSAR